MADNSCEVCGKKDSKYRCPGCSKKTCSLLCVKNHKEHFRCSGAACKTKYISQADYTDNTLLSDYRFLEDVDRLAYSAIRDGRSKRRQWNAQEDAPEAVRASSLASYSKNDQSLTQNHVNNLAKVQNLCRKAKRSGVNLKLMPVGMSKRKENSSMFDKGKNCVMWHIRWIFPQAGAEFVDKRISELEVVADVLKKYIDPEEADPVYKQRLKGYCRIGPHSVLVFFKMESQPANRLRYYQFDTSQTLKQCLTHKMVVEFPTLHVVLPEKASSYTSCLQDTPALQDNNARNCTMENVCCPAETCGVQNDAEGSILGNISEQS